MQLVKGRYISHYGAFKFTVPTMYQCAELCQVLDVCQSITFDKSLQQCKLNSITWNVETLTPNSSFIYAEKTNIPVVNIFRVCFCFCFSLVSSNNKTNRNVITEILLKVALSTIKQTNKQTFSDNLR
jgi:hypothetical protein